MIADIWSVLASIVDAEQIVRGLDEVGERVVVAGRVGWLFSDGSVFLIGGAKMKYAVQVRADGGYTLHSTHDSYRDAVGQADMVCGRVVIAATGLPNESAWKYAVSSQGFGGDFGDWQAMDDDERDEFEIGAGA